MPRISSKETARPSENRGGRALTLVLLAFAVFVAAAASALWLLTDGSLSPRAVQIGGPFSLTSGSGEKVTDKDFRGKYMLIYFGYTACPDACPTTLQEMTSALSQLGSQADRVQPIFITVDPGHDTPEVIGPYVSAFSPNLLGLTGSPEEIASVEKEYRIYSTIHRTGPGPDDYTVDHSSAVYLMGPDGQFIAPIPAEEPAPAMASDIAKHLS